MKRQNKFRLLSLLGAVVMAASVAAPLQNVQAAEEKKNVIVINEVDSAPADWVELLNTGKEDADISGYEIKNSSDEQCWKVPENTVLKAGEYYLVEDDTSGQSDEFEALVHFEKADSVRLYDRTGKLIDSFSWTDHAKDESGNQNEVSYSRYPDGTGEFAVKTQTPGADNGGQTNKPNNNQNNSQNNSTQNNGTQNNSTQDGATKVETHIVGSSTSAPKTGDTNAVTAFVILAVVAVAGIGVAAYRKKKEKI